MKYWWFNGGDEYVHHVPANILALPVRDSVGVSKSSWTRMKDVEQGDLIFCFTEGELDSLFVAHDVAERGELETRSGRAYQAYVVPGTHFELIKPIDPVRVHDQLAAAFDSDSPPWEQEPGRWGDIHAMAIPAGDVLLKLLDLQDDNPDNSLAVEAMLEALQFGDLPDQLASELIAARYGAGPLREKVEALYDRRCCLSGLSTPELLQVHHIKFWLYCTNDERLDPHNALLLSPTYRSAFVRGLISFDDEGRCLVSDLMDAGDADRLGLRGAATLPVRSDRQRAYLAWHREEIFRS